MAKQSDDIDRLLRELEISLGAPPASDAQDRRAEKSAKSRIRDALSVVLQLALFFIIIGWPEWVIGYWRLFPQPKPTPDEVRAQKVRAFGETIAGTWESFDGKRTVTFTTEGHKAVAAAIEPNTTEHRSLGTWQNTDSQVVLQASGDAGSFALTLEYVRGTQVSFLAPVPATSAMLKDCYLRVDEEEQDDSGYPP